MSQFYIVIKMRKTVVLVSVFISVSLICIWPSAASPMQQQGQLSLSRQKRQSDQRLAELETLLALQKYGRHRFRMDRKKGLDGEHPPGYGIIDFRMLGRKKKSLRFSPGVPGNLEINSGDEEDVMDRPLYKMQHKSPSSWHWEMERDQAEDDNGETLLLKGSQPFLKHQQKIVKNVDFDLGTSKEKDEDYYADAPRFYNEAHKK